MNLCIVERELLTASRRRDLYWNRFFFGGLILGIFCIFAWNFRASQIQMSVGELSQGASRVFGLVIVAQCGLAMLTAPTLFAGAFPDERQRKTLHYLLQTPLSGFEIVVGKLFAGLARMFSTLLVGVPIMSLFTLLGGVDPVLVVIAYLGTFTTIFLVGAFTLWVSAGSKKTGQVYFFVYVLGYFWSFTPVLIRSTPLWVGGGWSTAVSEGIHWVNEAIYPTTPFSLVSSSLGAGTMRGGWKLVEDVGRMIAFQLGYGTLFLVLAGWRLRRAFRKHEEATGWSWLKRPFRNLTNWSPRLPFLPKRPACGDNPVRWREMFVARVHGWTRLLTLLFGLGFAFGIAMIGYEYYQTRDKSNLHSSTLIISLYLYVIWLFTVTCLASGSIAAECDADTWSSLIATPMTARAIIRGKMLGALWRPRWAIVGVLIIWSLDCAFGELHPASLILGIVELVIFGWFAAALGIFTSMAVRLSEKAKSKATSQAMSAGGSILLLHGMFFMLIAAPYVYFFRWTPLMLVGTSPAVLAASLVSYDDFSRLISWGQPTNPDWIIPGTTLAEYFAAMVLSLGLHAGEAWFLMNGAIIGFHRSVGRPRRETKKAHANRVPASV